MQNDIGGDTGPGGIGPGGRRPAGGRSRSGPRAFHILLYILLGLGALGIVTCGVAVFFITRNPALREAVDAAVAAHSAPGAEALRAAGCREANVMDLSKTMEAVAEFTQLEAEPATRIDLFVTCQTASSQSELDCDDVARIYLEAVEELPELFLAQVVTGLSARPLCQATYRGDGSRVAALYPPPPGAEAERAPEFQP